MYKINSTQSSKWLAFKIFIITVLIIFILIIILWFLFFKNSGQSITTFDRLNGQKTTLVPPTKDFTVDEFKITLPEAWQFIGKQNPYYNEVYYMFQSKEVNKDNRWLRVYVNVIPEQYAVNRLLPISPSENKLITGEMSTDCKNFNGAPNAQNSVNGAQAWVTTWQDISFTCDLSGVSNQVGTASMQNGYAVPVTGEKSVTNKYFFVYIDQNAKPDYSILKNAVNSFIAL